MKIALFVEGPSDRDTLSILAQKVSPGTGLVTRVLGRGNLLNPDRVRVFIEEDVKKQHSDVRKVVLCVDSECTREEDLLDTLRPLERQLRRLVGNPPVFYSAVIHAIEAWLASDASALGRYLGSPNIADPTTRVVVNACRPKQALAKLFHRSRREFINVRDNPNLAHELDPQVAARTCRSFARFVRLVRDP